MGNLIISSVRYAAMFSLCNNAAVLASVRQQYTVTRYCIPSIYE